MKRLMIPAAFLAALLIAATVPLGTVWAGGGGQCSGVETTVSEETRVVTKGINCFMPTVLYIEPRQTVEFVFGFDGGHTVTGANLSWGSAAPADATVSYTFSEPGVYPYSCIYHPGMIGVIVVGDAGAADALADLTSSDGDTVAVDAGKLSDGGGLLDGTSWLGFGAVAAVVGGGGAFAAFRLRRGKTA